MQNSLRTSVAVFGLSLFGLIFGWPSGAYSAGFENTGSLATARGGHTATLLPNGMVLAAGGGNNRGAVYDAELYDPASRMWIATGSLAVSRAAHTATLLPDGDVLVAGGDHAFWSTETAELYDSASGNWRTTGSLTWQRRSQTATVLLNGKVLVAGGAYDDAYGSFTWATAELYDSASGNWTLTGSLATSRASHTATLLPNGKVLVAGGYVSAGVDQGFLASAELYDPTTGTWVAAASLATARGGHSATSLPNGKVLVAGGYNDGGFLMSAELYDPESGTWAVTGSLNTGRSEHTATLLTDGTVLVAGGTDPQGFLASAELYHPETGTWTTTGSLAMARTGHTATLLPDSTVLVAGGTDDSVSGTALDSAELFLQPAALLNISTRLDVQTGDNVMIGGFIVTGTEPQTVIVRGIGPSMSVSGALSDPMIELHDASGALIAANDNWKDDPNQQHVIDSRLAPPNDLESALWAMIDPGAYTVIIKGKNDETGVGLVEVYQVNQGSDAKLANISTRGLVQTDDNVLIGGLVVDGGTQDASVNVVVRALGPSLPITGPLADPTLELHDGSGTLIDTNDDWKTRPDGSSQEAEIEATTVPPDNDLESALVEILPPGNYTAIVRGKENTAGVGLVEIYNLP